MTHPGHVLIGTNGELLGVDAAFCDIMQSKSSAMIGRSVMDVTAVADRPECAEAIRILRETKRPFVIVKRFSRDDGSLVWVRNTVSITSETEAPALIMATIEPVDNHEVHQSPANLVDAARFLISAQEARAEICDPAILLEPAWCLILGAYVAEAEGRALDIPALAAIEGMSPPVAERWIRVLVGAGVLEIEYRRPTADAPKAYRLTLTAHLKLEQYLSNFRLNVRAAGREELSAQMYRALGIGR